MSAATTVRWRAGRRTQIGRRPAGEQWHRNDDFSLIDADLGLVLVLDGGGNWGGPDERGRRGAEVIQQVVRNGLNATPPRDLIEQAFRVAGETLRAELDEHGDSGGALVILLFLAGGQSHVAWLGDAMGHRVSGGAVAPITEPHTFANELRRRGQLTQEVLERQAPGTGRVLLHFLGAELPDPFGIISSTPEPGERLILTTDGVHDVLTGPDFLAACQAHTEPQACADRLVELAIERGSRDNCTCVVVAFEESGEEPLPVLPPRPWWHFWR